MYYDIYLRDMYGTMYSDMIHPALFWLTCRANANYI